MAAAKKERHITITEQIARLDITPALQMMYAEIVHLSNGRGYCYANNQHFESRFRKSDSCIVRWIKTLEKKELVFRLVIRSYQGTERRLYIEKTKYKEACEEHKGQSLTGRQLRQPGASEMTTGGSKECAPGVVKSEHPGSQEQTPGVVKSEHHNNTVNITSNTTVEYSSSTEVEESFQDPESDSPDDKKREEKEKGSAQKEKEELQGLSEKQLDKIFLDPYYHWYKAKIQAKKVKLHESTFPAITKIRHFLTDSEGGVKEALAMWVDILENWAKLPNFLQSQLKARQIAALIDDFLVNIRNIQNKGSDVPYVNEAIDLYKEVFRQQKGFPPNINGKAGQHITGTLSYLKDFQEGNTWEMAFKGFELILRSWPELEKQEDFYKENFTLSYINGNTSKIITILKSRRDKQPSLTVDSAQAWLERNRLSA